MARREPTRVRRAPTRAPRRTVLVVVGARRTEIDYLKGLRDHFKLATLTLKIKPGAPDQLVEYTRDNFPPERYDEIWCVTDVDSFEREGGKVTAALALAAEAGINLAVSDPCFELWLLLHHEDCTAYCAGREAVERRLRRSVPDYDRAGLRFQDFAGGLDKAIIRAKALDPAGNPSTGVWRLVSALMEKE